MELKAYAIDFVSFMVQKIKKIESVNSIILFGSVARGSETKESDIDLFIEMSSKNENKKNALEKDIQTIKKQFYSSIKFKDYWKLKGIDNEINVLVGNLKEWKLKDSMIGSSIILYQKYEPQINKGPNAGENKTLLSWDVIKPNSKRVMLNKNLFGYNHYGKRYPGLIEKYNAEKIGSNVILINSKDISEFEKEFKKFNIAAKIRNVFEYKK